MRWILVGIIVASNACADLMDTVGMRRNGPVEDFTPSGIVRLIRALARNRFVLGGLVAMAVSFFALMALLSIEWISFAIPATGGTVVLETLLAKVILKEDVHWRRWVGAVAVSFGVALLAFP